MEGHKNFELSMERVITFLDHTRGRVAVFFLLFFAKNAPCKKKKAPESLLFL